MITIKKLRGLLQCHCGVPISEALVDGIGRGGESRGPHEAFMAGGPGMSTPKSHQACWPLAFRDTQPD